MLHCRLMDEQMVWIVRQRAALEKKIVVARRLI